METEISYSYQEMVQNPMYPDDPTKTIPTGTLIENIKENVRFIQDSRTTEGYGGSPSSYSPNTFKFILTTNPIPEGSTFSQFGLNWVVGKLEKPTAFGDNYGYRSPIQVV